MMNGLGMYGSGWLIGMSMMILFWVAVIVLVIWAVRSLFPAQSSAGRERPLETLQRRYATGEISAAEYEQARSRLAEIPTE
jgi:putative membrane protein